MALVAPQVAVSWLVGLVNEYAAVPRAVAGEEALPLPDLALPAPAGNLHLHVDREQLLQLAEGLHAVFAAAHRGGEDFARALNAILLRTRPWPHLGAGEIVWTAGGTHGRHDAHLQALTAGSALALLDFQCRYGQQRLGLCAADRCADVYADVSAAGRRRFCSPACLNRHKVAAHRSRRRRAQPFDQT